MTDKNTNLELWPERAVLFDYLGWVYSQGSIDLPALKNARNIVLRDFERGKASEAHSFLLPHLNAIIAKREYEYWFVVRETLPFFQAASRAVKAGVDPIQAHRAAGLAVETVDTPEGTAWRVSGVVRH